MYALVDIKGRQYKAQAGGLLRVGQLSQAKGETVEFDSVLMTSDGNAINVGTPYVTGARVKAVVEEQGMGAKVLVFKYRKRKGYRRKRGHRQGYTVLRVAEITG